MKIFLTIIITSITGLLFAQSQSSRFKIESDVIGALVGDSNSTRFENFGVNEPITGLSIKDLPDIKNFAGFVGKIVPLDQDMDGLPDYEEVALGTDKTKADTDGDGLTDKEEVELGTDTLKTDTDGDGYSDLAEVNASTNPKDAQSNPNRAPVFDIKQTLTIAENQPIGTLIGQLRATDPDGHVLTYELAVGLLTSSGLSTVGHKSYSHSLFVGTAGTLWAKGTNYNGQLGDGTTVSKSEPILVIEEGVRAVDVGEGHSLFLKNDNSLWSMGSNNHGQLGDGTTKDRSTPIKVDDNVVLMSAGSYHSMYVKTDGSLWVMGRNWYGELGTGKNGNDGNWQNYYYSFKEGFDVSEPIKIDDNVISISAGEIHSLYVKADGSLWSMGLNDRGQLGDGTVKDRNSPIKVVNSHVQAVSAGSQVSAFIKSDGSLWKLGSSIVKLDEDVVSISSGFDDIFYIKSDRTLRSIGFNVSETDSSGDNFSENLSATSILLDQNILFVSGNSNEQEILYQKADGTFWQQTKRQQDWPLMPTWQGASKVQIQFSGSGGISPKSFELSPEGVLTSSRIFDHESEPTINFEAKVRDEMGGTDRKAFTVIVSNIIEDLDGDGIEDANDPDMDGDGFTNEDELADGKDPLDPASNPNRKPTLVNITSFTIRENKAIGTTVGTLQANDANGDDLTFSLLSISGNTDHESFTLQNDGVLKTKAIFDYESKNKYILKARVSDGRGGLAEMQFEVLVSNDILDDTDVVGMMDDDKDGLSNDAEKNLGTDPNKADSDGDGLNDRDEIIFGSNPLQPDTDGDGLNDQQEYTLGSDPLQKDTDGDGYDDQAEHTAGTLLEDRFDYPGSKDDRTDPDTKTDSPDGLLYQIHFAEKGLPLDKTKRLASRLNGKIAEISEDDSVLKNYLLSLMAKENVEAESDSLGLMGVWIQSKEEPDATTMMDVDGDLYIDEVEPEDRLAVILAFEIPEVYPPIIQTFSVDLTGETFQVEASLLEDGGETPFRYGFEITESLLVTDNTKKRIVSGNMKNGTNRFGAMIDRLIPGITYYIRPFAENSAGLTRGNFKRLKIEPEYATPFDGVESGEENWMTSSWFGSFHRANDNWIYHAELEWWIYVANEAGFGQWFWTEEIGWCWTAKAIHPFIWKHSNGAWLFRMGIKRQGKSVFWNYATGSADFY